MSESKYSLPPRKWYTLEQAAKRISKLTGEEIEVADLLHYWQVSMLDLSIDICYLNDLLSISCKNVNIIKSNLYLIGGYEIDGENILNIGLDDIYISLFNTEDSKRSFSGLISIATDYVPQELYKRNLTENYISFKDDIFLISQPDDGGAKVIIMVDLDNSSKLNITLNDFFVLESSIQDFLSNKKPSSILGLELDKLKQQEKKPANKTLNSQAEFIRNLIIMSYGEEVADSIRKELDNPNSEISIDFQTKGLKAPSGKTVDRWINQI